MSASAAQFRFAAEFISFLAAAAGLALVALRADAAGRRIALRAALVIGFAALALGAHRAPTGGAGDPAAPRRPGDRKLGPGDDTEADRELVGLKRIMLASIFALWAT